MDMILLHLSNTLERNLWNLKKRKELYRFVIKSSNYYTQSKTVAYPRKMLILQGNLNTFQKERDRLLAEVESLNADGQTHKVRDAQLQKLKTFEAQVNGSS